MPFHKVFDGNNRVDVRQFGAKGDYDPTLQTGTDDRNSFSNAITTAIATGSDLVIPPGTYYISKYVLIQGARGLRIIAVGLATIYFGSDTLSTTRDATALSHAQARSCFLLKNSHSVVFDNIAFVGGATTEITNANLGCGIYATRCIGTRVLNCRQRAGYSLFVQDAGLNTTGLSGSTLTLPSGVATLTNNADPNAAFHSGMVDCTVTIDGTWIA